MATCQKYAHEEGVRSECATGERVMPGRAGDRGQSRFWFRSPRFRTAGEIFGSGGIFMITPLSFQAPRRVDDTTSSESASHGDLRGSMRPYMSDTSSDAPGDDPPQGRGRRVRRPPACGTGDCLEAPPARRGRRGGRQGE
ncbi:hypothetical protein PIB30_042812 [Stylosanthes scabra]|uniref:Uncharacterized protein n=1 Tax=Stylosanthes scabra TaxID=79078 RepID=A0ABU6TF04_9FABA|nr:hypothetical protein [Stylosanthes scabra]